MNLISIQINIFEGNFFYLFYFLFFYRDVAIDFIYSFVCVWFFYLLLYSVVFY